MHNIYSNHIRRVGMLDMRSACYSMNTGPVPIGHFLGSGKGTGAIVLKSCSNICRGLESISFPVDAAVATTAATTAIAPSTVWPPQRGSTISRIAASRLSLNCRSVCFRVSPQTVSSSSMCRNWWRPPAAAQPSKKMCLVASAAFITACAPVASIRSSMGFLRHS